MAKFDLDLKKFKHVKGSDQSTTLMHEKGHIITLAHKGLSKEFQKQLEAMPKSKEKVMMAEGSPGWDQYKAPPPADPHQPAPVQSVHDKTTSEEDKQRHKEQDETEAKGKDMGLYAEGGIAKHPHEQTPYDQGLPCLNPHCKSHGRPHPNCRCYSGGENYAEGGKVEYFCDTDRKHFSKCEYHKSGEVSQQGNDVKYANKAIARGDNKEAKENFHNAKIEAKGRIEMERHVKPNIKGLAEGGEPNEAPPMLRADLPEVDESAEKAVNDAQNFITPPSDQQAVPEEQPQIAQPDEPQQETPAPQPQVTQKQAVPQPQQTQQPNETNLNPVQRFADHKQQAENHYMQEDEAWSNDLRNGHIKPETFQGLFAKQSTPAKIGTLFGLLLSGAGSGLSHQPNAVMEMMQKEIQNDLAAQQNSKQNAENYLRLGQQHAINQAQAKNLDIEAQTKSYALANMRMNRAALQTLINNVQKMPPGSPQRQQGEAAMAMMNNAVQSENYTIAQRAATASAYYKMLGIGQDSQQGQGQPEAAFQQQQKAKMMLGPEGEKMAKFELDRHIADLPSHVTGKATNPIPEDIRNRLQAQTILDNKGKDLLGFIKKHTGSWNPQTRALGEQKLEELKNFYNGSISGGALTNGRLAWYDEQFKKNPTDLFPQLMGSTKRLEEVVNSNTMRRDSQLKNLGFNVGKPQESSQMIERFDPKSGKTAIFDSNKKFIKWK